MDSPEFFTALRDVNFGVPLSAATAVKLAAICTRQDFPEGALIFDEGAKNPLLYLIVEGQVGLEMCVPARGCTRILTLGSGDLLAWSALLGDGRMTATAVALTPTRTLAASAPDLKVLCAADHDFGYEWMHAMAVALSKRLTATRLQLLDLYGDAK
jgi:CRP/FNR family cyclic AMP-dependent transcriptional regulator